jgi:hypothetical protein
MWLKEIMGFTEGNGVYRGVRSHNSEEIKGDGGLQKQRDF